MKETVNEKREIIMEIRKLRKWRIISVGIIVVLVTLTVKSQNSYLGLLKVNEQLNESLELEKSEKENITANYNILLKRYEELEHKYRQTVDSLVKYKETEIPVYDFTQAEIELIALCVEAEAGYYEYAPQSQRYVTQVILNRLHSSKFPNRVEEVIYQKVKGVPQFSVAYNGMMDKEEIQPETLANVYNVIVHGTNLPEYVCYFYSDSVSENWVNTLPVYCTSDGTVFAYDKEEFR